MVMKIYHGRRSGRHACGNVAGDMSENDVMDAFREIGPGGHYLCNHTKQI